MNGSTCLQKSTSRTVGWNCLNYSIISRKMSQRLSFHRLNYCTVTDSCLWSPWATCIFKYHWRYISSSTEKLQQSCIWWRRPGRSSANSRTSVAAQMWHAPRFSGMPHYSLLVYSTIIRLQLNPAQDIMSWVHPTTRFVIATNSTAVRHVAPFLRWCVSSKRLRSSGHINNVVKTYCQRC